MIQFQTKIPILLIFEGLALEYGGIFYGHFIYFTAKWYILLPFGAFCGHLVILLSFGAFCDHLIHFPVLV
jgi:hypothetical protein